MKNERSGFDRLTDRIYGGLPMSWPVVVLFAVGAAALTAFCLYLPAFKNTSFERIGVYLEAWIFFAVIIMANCKTPLESAAKTFVFFLVSQPLIYLFQVPFTVQGWGLFRYYRYWLILTLLTFPAAFVGWYIKKRNWLSLLILAPVLCLLTYTGINALRTAVRAFPRLLFTGLFCLGQVLLYLHAFTEKRAQKLVGFLVPFAAVMILLLARPQVEIDSTRFLPGDPVLTKSAVVETEEGGSAEVTVAYTGEDSMIRIRTRKFGRTAFAIRDGEAVYRYVLTVYEDEGGHSQIDIVPAD